MFPVGPAIGALFAAQRRMRGPTKARCFGRRFIAQSAPGTQWLVTVIPWMLALVGALSAAANAKEGAAPIIGMLTIGLLSVPLFISPSGRHFLFDDEGIEVISPWRRRRFLAYREIVRVRRTFEHEGFVLRTVNGMAVHIPDNLSGGITLAAKVLKHLPEGAKVSRAARAKLLASSVIDAE
jgi:hypothetical protein